MPNKYFLIFMRILSVSENGSIRCKKGVIFEEILYDFTIFFSKFLRGIKVFITSTLEIVFRRKRDFALALFEILRRGGGVITFNVNILLTKKRLS